MNQQIEKLRLIYKPFLIIAICVVGGYTFLNWLLFIHLQVFSLNEDIKNYWIPFALPWIPVLIWLWPRIKLLNLKSRKGGDLPGLYLFIAGFAIVAPTIVAQSYIEKAAGKLTQLDDITQIEKLDATKYYSISTFYIDKNHIGVQGKFGVSGRHNEYFDMDLFVVLPIFAIPADTSGTQCLAWYGVKYHESISNRLDENEKQDRFRRFANESQADFDRKNINRFIYLDRIGNTNDHKGYIEAIENNRRYSGGSTTVLIPVYEPFGERNGNKLGWIFGAFGIGAFVWLIMLLIPKFDPVALKKFKDGKPIKKRDIRELLSFFVPREGFYITPIIIELNIIIFLLMVFSGKGFISFNARDLLNWGANYRPSTTNGEWWRLLTSTFLHGGLMHLFANMYGLLFVGIFLEPRLGKIKYAIIYLATGILASAASLWWHDATVSIGASGAIFGLYGVFLALLLTKAYPKNFSKAFLTSTLIFIGYNLFMGITGGIDNAAHIGGLVSGFIIGLILHLQLKEDAKRRARTVSQ